MLRFQYEIIFYWSHEDRVFMAEVLELLDCMTHGKTQEKALLNVKTIVCRYGKSI